MEVARAVDDLLAAVFPGRVRAAARGEPCCARCRAALAPPPAAPPPPGIDWWDGVLRVRGRRARARRAGRSTATSGAASLSRRLGARDRGAVPHGPPSSSSRGRPRARASTAVGRRSRRVARARSSRELRRAGPRAAPPRARARRRPARCVPRRRGPASARSVRSPDRRSSSSTTSPRPVATLARRARCALADGGRTGPVLPRASDRATPASRTAASDVNSLAYTDGTHVDVVVVGKHVRSRSRLRAVTLEKLERIDKYANDVRRVDVDYGEHQTPTAAGDSHTCEILVHLNHHLVKGTAAAAEHVDGARPRARQGRAPDAPAARTARRAAATAHARDGANGRAPDAAAADGAGRRRRRHDDDDAGRRS